MNLQEQKVHLAVIFSFLKLFSNEITKAPWENYSKTEAGNIHNGPKHFKVPESNEVIKKNTLH